VVAASRPRLKRLAQAFWDAPHKGFELSTYGIVRIAERAPVLFNRLWEPELVSQGTG